MKKNRFKIIGGLVIIASMALFTVHACSKKSPVINLETVKIIKGAVSNNVTATGTIQAIKTVAVGTQVSGVIQKLYADFNSVIKKGQILAELDKTPLLAALDNAQASLDDAKSEVTYQTANFNRIKALHDKNLVAQSDYDLALYNLGKANTSLKMAVSNYSKSKINLDYATVYSPIDGVVLNRAVDEGQTVAASFSTPTLFTIVNDLTQMQVAANIDEADIGQVIEKQKVEFTVDAFPDIKFTGEVMEKRLQSTTTSNVVTYTVIVKAPNPDKKLMPGMTASITVIVNKADNVLTVSGKALRFKPDQQMLMVYNNTPPEKDRIKNTLSGAAASAPVVNVNMSGTDNKLPEPSASFLWIKTGKNIHAVNVVTGITDGITTEIKSGVNEGDEVLVSMTSTAKTETKTASSSPFMPKPPSDKRK